MKISLIAMDLDGTLKSDTKEITPRTCAALMEAQKRGIRLVLASARPSPGLRRECDTLNMQNFGGILMSYNGGRIVEAAKGQVLYETAMEKETAVSLLQFLKTLPVTPILDDGKQFYVTDAAGYKVDYECKNNDMVCTEVEDLTKLDFAPVKILMSVREAQLKETQARIAAVLPPELHVLQTAPFYLEIIPSGINKGRGLETVCRLLNIPLEETVAFGDQQNDITMIQKAGMGVAMGNAAPEVKAVADQVPLSNNDDGIAYILEQFL